MARPIEASQMKMRHGQWKLVRELGRGAFGRTYAATGPDGQEVALKLLDVHPASEIRSLSAVAHPCIPRLVSSGTEPSSWVAFERVRGQTLASRLSEGPMESAEAVRHAAALFDALAHLHHDGVSHGDVKPDNLMIDEEEDALRLIDFGLSGALGAGTPAYAAPEVSSGKGGPACDVYSAALVFWEILYGALPWPDLGLVEAMLRRRGEAPRPESAPLWLVHFFRRALSPIPDRRAGAGELRNLLADQGAVLPSIGRSEVLARAKSIHVPREEDGVLSQWIEQGGSLKLAAPRGAGATHQLARCAAELSARGRPVLRVLASSTPWAAVERALMDPCLGPTQGCPSETDHWTLVVAFAAALAARSDRRIALLIDSSEALDSSSAEVVEFMAVESMADVLWFVGEENRFEDSARLQRWTGPDFSRLAASLLPGLVLGEQVCKVFAQSSLGPRELTLALLEALEQGELRRGSLGYVLDESRLPERAGQNEFPALQALTPLAESWGFPCRRREQSPGRAPGRLRDGCRCGGC